MKSSECPNPAAGRTARTVRATVLLADDDADFRGLVRVAVEEAAASLVPPVCVEVHEVSDGEAAVRFLRRSPARPALLLMDVEMPGGDGLTALRAVKSSPDLHDVPTVMLSGRDDDATVRAATATGANGYVVKPRRRRGAVRGGGGVRGLLAPPAPHAHRPPQTRRRAGGIERLTRRIATS